MSDSELDSIEARLNLLIQGMHPAQVPADVEEKLLLLSEIRRLQDEVEIAFERGVDHGYEQCNLESSEREY